jgi:hypothetical protein
MKIQTKKHDITLVDVPCWPIVPFFSTLEFLDWTQSWPLGDMTNCLSVIVFILDF